MKVEGVREEVEDMMTDREKGVKMKERPQTRLSIVSYFNSTTVDIDQD